MSRRFDLPLAAAVVALGLMLWLGVGNINPGAGYDRIGPRFFPLAVAAGMVLLGLALAGSHFRGVRLQADQGRLKPAPTDMTALGYLALGLLVFLILSERVGFLVAATLQFWLVARAFGSRRPGRDAIAALATSVIVYFLFSKSLGLPLPEGLLERLL